MNLARVFHCIRIATNGGWASRLSPCRLGFRRCSCSVVCGATIGRGVYGSSMATSWCGAVRRASHSTASRHLMTGCIRRPAGAGSISRFVRRLRTPACLCRGWRASMRHHSQGNAPLSQTRKLLDVQGLSVGFATDHGVATVVRELDLHVGEGETLAIVGESGSGKSVTALSITRLIDHTGGRITAGRIGFTDRTGRQRDLAREPQEAMRRLRGPEIAMVFQEPMSSLNPVLRIGEQIAEAVMLHQGLAHTAALAEARRLLERVRIPDAARQLGRYPFQLSGGMRQRVMIAM